MLLVLGIGQHASGRMKRFEKPSHNAIGNSRIDPCYHLIVCQRFKRTVLPWSCMLRSVSVGESGARYGPPPDCRGRPPPGPPGQDSSIFFAVCYALLCLSAGGGGGRWKGVRERDVDRRHGGEDGSRLVRSAPAGSRPSRHAAESLKRRPRVFLGLLIYCYYLFF